MEEIGRHEWAVTNQRP